jgi:stage V sporulation protein SpoVS
MTNVPGDVIEGEIVLKIKATKDSAYTKRVAGAMSWRLREQGYCKARAVKADAVNTATKAVAIVNQWVYPVGVTLSMDLSFGTVEKADGGAESDATAIAMTVCDVADCPRPTEFVEYRVSGKDPDTTVVSRLAGAIAVPARKGNGVRMNCIGPSAVYRAIMACTIAKGYIYPNNLEAIVVPTWGAIPARSDGAEPTSFIQIDFWGRQLN